jgi:hypothetical protein
MDDETTQQLEQRLNKQIDEIRGQVRAADEMYRAKLNRRIYVLIEIEMRLRKGGKPIASLAAAVQTAVDARDVTPPLVERLLDTAEALAHAHASSLVEEREHAHQSSSASVVDLGPTAESNEWPGLIRIEQPASQT